MIKIITNIDWLETYLIFTEGKYERERVDVTQKEILDEPDRLAPRVGQRASIR